MANIIDQIGQAASGAVQSAENAAAQLLHTAQKETATLGHVANGLVQGPLAQRFGSNPVEFINNSVKAFFADFVAIVNDVASRAGRSTYVAVNPQTGKNVNVPARVQTNTSFNVVVLTVALAARDHGALLVDATGRHVAGVGGTGKGLDDVHWWPGMGSATRRLLAHHQRTAHGFIEGAPIPTPLDFAALTAVVTVIVAIAPLVIGALTAAVGFVKNIVAPPPPPKPASTGIFGIPPIVLIIVAAAGLGLVFLWKPAAKAAA